MANVWSTTTSGDAGATPWGETDINVGRTERWISGIAGAALVGYGIRRKRLRTLAVPLGLGLAPPGDHRPLRGQPGPGTEQRAR